MKKTIFMLCLMLVQWLTMAAQGWTTQSDIAYKQGDDYVSNRCKLDIYYSPEASDNPVVIWFHGGGLTSGNKYIPEELKDKGLVVVAVNYRLLPKVTIDECLDDCAAAVAWVFSNIGKYGGNSKQVFVSGHSAGGYITAMLGLDKSWLQHYDVDANSIAGLIPFSGQMISHFAYRDMNGLSNLQPLVDRFAPLFHVRKDAAPLVLITGDREHELFGRYEENAYMWRMMQLVGHPATTIFELDGHGHGAMCHPAFHILLQEVNKLLGKKYEY